MTREEAIEYLKCADTTVGKKMKTRTAEALEMAIQSLTAISELSKSLKAVNRYDMDEKVLIGFNMAVAIFNKCFGEIGEMSERQADGDLISRKAVKDLIRKFKKQFVQSQDEKYFDYVIAGVELLPSAEKTAEWIPVKDRMPEFNDIVLASTVSDYDELRVIITVYKAEEFWFNGTIKAWMPVPEPYKAE